MTDSQGITAPDSFRRVVKVAVATLAGQGPGKTSEYSSTEAGL
ncbi:hypothetical protein [Enterobacter kobei]|nr:hypothetical protein [Enterobacter kobei]